MQSPSTPVGKDLALFQAVLDEAVAGGEALMRKLVTATSRALYAREIGAHSLQERDAVIASAQLLRAHEAQLRTAFPGVLRAAFQQGDKSKKRASVAMEELHFDQLELMDEGQVQESVSLARAQQVALLAADAPLAELNTLICSTLGLVSVRPESNPMRPEAYVGALKEVMDQVAAPSAARQEWFAAMSVALGNELRDAYSALVDKLRGRGVVAAGYVVLPAASGATGGVAGRAHPAAPARLSRGAAPFVGAGDVMSLRLSSAYGAVPAPQVGPASPPLTKGKNEALLTLDKLRQLLAGELELQGDGNRLESFAQQFAREFESNASQPQAPVSDFASTVPAAFEALTEMRQVDRVVQRLEQRQGAVPVPLAKDDASIVALRETMRRNATGVAQALSLEVVSLMVDNLARDPRLLEPIQRLVRSLEPALMRLALADPRFFSDKHHPARQLLMEITQRSLAYVSVQTPGFAEFVQGLEQAVQPLLRFAVENADPFVRVLEGLHEAWKRAEQDKDRAKEEVVAILQHAEQRNVLAEKIARKVEAHPEAALVPDVVMEFLCGPWSQVVAQARIVGGSGSKAADKYEALISALLWSAHPQLPKKNIAKLTRLVPLLLSTLRDGLDSIHYPATKTSVFLEALMGLHQRAFRSDQKAAEVPPASAPLDVPAPLADQAVSTTSKRLLEEGNPWIAPQEAQASNFMAWPELPPIAPVAAPAEGLSGQQTTAQTPPVPAVGSITDADALDALPLGSWVEMWTNDAWVRAQLTWASPHGTLFLFTNAFGTPHSMTRRLRDKLTEAGHLRLISGQAVVDGALNAVAQTAMRNSMDTTL